MSRTDRQSGVKFAGNSADNGPEDIAVDFFPALLSGLMTVIGYGLLLASAYKLFQIATTLGEIKELLKGQRRNESLVQAAAAMTTVTADLSDPLPGDDDASEYARNLLRAVKAKPQRAGSGHSD